MTSMCSILDIKGCSLRFPEGDQKSTLATTVTVHERKPNFSDAKTLQALKEKLQAREFDFGKYQEKFSILQQAPFQIKSVEPQEQQKAQTPKEAYWNMLSNAQSGTVDWQAVDTNPLGQSLPGMELYQSEKTLPDGTEVYLTLQYDTHSNQLFPLITHNNPSTGDYIVLGDVDLSSL